MAVASGSGKSAELLEEHVRKLLPSAQIVRVTDGSRATEIISEQRPDLIVVDTVSAGLNGFTVCSKLKQDERTGSIPQICFCSPDDKESRIRALESGADGMLSWPPDNDELRAMAHSLVKGVEKHNKQLAHLEKTIRENERLYDTLLNNIELISVTLDRNGRITSCNDYLLNITGWRREDILWANWFEIFIPPDIENIKRSFSDFLDDLPSAWHNENEILTRSGERRLISWNNSVLQSADGTVVGTASIGEDITERKLIEKSLIESEQKYRAFFENSMDAILLTTPDGSVMAANPAACKMFGRTEREIIKLGRSGLVDNSDPRLQVLLARRDQTGKTEGELYFLRKDGTRFHAEISSAIFYDIGGKQKTSMIIRDITRRKKLEAEVREREEKYRKMFMDNPQPMWIYDMETLAFLEVNEAAVLHYGYSREEFLSKNIKDIRPADEVDALLKNINPARKKFHKSGEWRHIKKNGEIITVEIISHNVIFEGRKARHVMVNDITDRKLQEQKIREQDLQFRKLSANVHDLIFQFTRKPDGTYIVPIASEGIKNIFGCSPEDVINDFGPIARVIHPEDLEKVINDIEYSARNLSYFTCEFRVQRAGHPLQWILSRSTPELLPDGSITWYGFNADITYRKQIEEALRESESKFRKIYEEGPYGMAVINREHKFVLANRTFCRITGYDESELLKLTFYDITHPDDRDASLEIHSRLVARETDVIRSEKRYLKKDGSVIWVSVTVTSNYDDTGAFMFNLAIVEDISVRKFASEQVSILNERLSFLVEAVQELSTSATLEGIMKTVLDSARRLLNADGATFALRDGDLCYFADEDAVGPLWKGQRFPMDACISGWVMQNRQAVMIEDVYANNLIPNEIYLSTFIRSLAVAPIRINNPLGAVGAYWSSIFSPSTAELQLLQTLADAAAKAVENVQLIEGLENTISDRTADLQAVNRELEAFSYSVSHDLRAPLRHINGFSEILLRKYSEQIPPGAVKYLETIVGSATRMGTLIDDLLSLSRTARAELNKRSVNMNNIVSDAILEVNQNPGDRKIDWQIAELPESFCDPNLMHLVWVNLIDNALKYTSTREKAVIRIGYTTEAGEFIYFIGDNGVGFDMKYAQKLFGVFQRMHSSAEFEGTGIGLANVQRIIMRHGGRTWAEAEPDKGAVFSFSLPRPNKNT